MSFIEWLESEKGLSKKSAHDVASRFGRVKRILEIEDDKCVTIEAVESSCEYVNLTMTVKSQLKRSIVLMQEYLSNF